VCVQEGGGGSSILGETGKKIEMLMKMHNE